MQLWGLWDGGLVSYKQAQNAGLTWAKCKGSTWSGTAKLPLSSSMSVKLVNALIEQVQDTRQGWDLLNRLLLQ